MKKAPVLFTILLTIAFFTLLGILGKSNIYATQEQDLTRVPFLSAVFTGINDDIYPWDILNETKRSSVREEARLIMEKEEEMLRKQEEALLATPTPVPTPVPTPISASPSPVPTGTPMPTPEPTPKYPEGRYEPLRESTYDEYINHISADIYGDMGVLRAKEYEFSKVDETYFDDALFIGDSRTVGLRDYTDLSDHADFLCETSLTIAKAMKSDYKGKGTVESFLNKNEYGKVYLMVGVNELGSGTTEDYMAQYTECVDRIHELEPDAIIFVEAIMDIDKERSDSDPIFNNTNILARNHAIATLADNETFFYIDVNEVVTDEEGYLLDDLRGDHLHLRGASNEVWKEFLLNHGVLR